MSIREVLAATDFSEIADDAVRAARQHAARFGTRRHVIHVLEHDIDLIVVGTHGRTGMSRVLLGSVAERVIRTAPWEPSADLICGRCRARIRGKLFASSTGRNGPGVRRGEAS